MKYKIFFHKLTLQEKIPLSLARKYVKGWNKDRLNDWFKGKYRLYLPLVKEKQAAQDIKSDLEKDIDRALENTQFKVKDFTQGVAIDTKNNREIKLGKVLQKLDKNLLQQFSASESRTGSKIKECVVVISRHPYDIAGQSFDRGWTSCKNLSGGVNAKYVADEVNSVLIAYLVYKDDKNINKPISRILINQFFNNKGQVAYIPQISIYGSAGVWETSFITTVKSWLKSVQGEPKGVYKMNPFEYADSLSTTIEIIDFSNLPDWVVKTGNRPESFEYTKYGRFVWEDGVWKDGVWENGNWKDGRWEKGTWEDGDWEKGDWKNGTWEDGVWVKGVWEKGTWKDGFWKGGTWKFGVWEAGTWEKGDWKTGRWEDGVWENGTWKDGVWENGVWENGVWENGTWKDGVWENGNWGKGVWKNGTWEKGDWKTGRWEDGVWENGVWENGVWENGVWENGTWKDGVWENGNWGKGVWKNGWIYDPNRVGNYKPEWQWRKDFVQSPINPKEYFNKM